jgi:hypothetical protein
VELCNFLGACGQISRSFAVSSSSDVPVVSFRSSSLISTFRNRSVLISADAFVSLCGTTKKSTSSLSYEWSVWLGNELQNSPSLRSVSLNPMQFKLPPYRLRSDSVYVVTLRVTHLISSKSASNSVEVNVNPGSLVCFLSFSFFSSLSSSSPTPFVGSEIGLRVDDSLLLDLSRSYDEDLYTGVSHGNTATRGMMMFEWSCIRVSPFTFVLSLNFRSRDERVFSTSVTIQTNSPPSLCEFEVSPQVGVILETTFLMSSSRCVDEDLPISYQFGYSSLDKMVVLRSKLELSHTSTHLPLGSPETNYSLSCLTRVFDSLDASRVFVFDDVVVGKNANQSIQVKDYLMKGLNESLGDPDSLKSVVSLTTSVLNVVDCSLSPVSYCSSLNRQRCDNMPNTCGECTSGHVGVSGPSNTPCLSASETSRRDETTTTTETSRGNGGIEP